MDFSPPAVAAPKPPKEPPHYPFEPVLTQALADAQSLSGSAKLQAIVAPVGYGKTVLMTTLYSTLEAEGQKCYWTTLEERDTQLEDLLGYLEGHSRSLRHQTHPTQALFRGGDAWETRVDRLLRLIRSMEVPFTAFIDNLHFCDDPRLRQLLDRLIFETQDEARFIVSSTAAIPMNLVRAKLEGRVREIGFSALSLDLEGVASMLGATLADKLGPQHLQAILEQTEGWPAAVRMMQIVMAKSDEPETLLKQFSGSDQDLVALLNRQVLDGLPSELRAFLLSIALLETFNAPLAAFVTKSSRAQQHIDYLIDHNLFVMPLDRNRRDFRLHGLMRQCLRGEGQIELSSAHRAQLMTRAAQWCEEQGKWRQAIEYAIEGGASDIAVRVLERSAQALVRNQGDIPQYIVWTRRLLDQGNTLGWEAEYWYVWALVLNQRYDEGRHQLARLARRIDRTRGLPGEEANLRDIERRLEIIRMCIDVFTDALADANDKAMRWLESGRTDDPFDITVARCIRSIYSSSVYDFFTARDSIRAGNTSALQAQSHYALGWTTALTALPSVMEGHYEQAIQPLLASLKVLPGELGDSAGICGTIALLAATCLIETGEEEQARTLIQQGFRTAQSHGFIDALSSGMDAAIKLCANPLTDRDWVANIDQIVSHYPLRLAYLVGCHWIRRLLRLGHEEEAQRRARTLGIVSIHDNALPDWACRGHGWDVYSSTLADVKLSEPHLPADTEPLISEVFERAKAEGRTARMVDARLMQCILHFKNGNLKTSARRLIQAINLAASHAILRPFADRARELAPLIEDTRPSAWGFARSEERELFSKLCAQLPLSDPSLNERLIAGAVKSDLSEALTKRQMELLQLIEAGLSNQHISDRLDLSVSTVKGHLQNLYRKLGVPSRSAAIARARVLKLL